MSLLDKNVDGIFHTLVSWEILEKETRKALKTSATFGDAKEAKLVGDGNGFCSRIALVTFDWRGEGANSLPKKMLIKIASCLNCVKMIEQQEISEEEMRKQMEQFRQYEGTMRKCHNSECSFYQLVTEKLGSDQAFEKFGLPRYHFSVPFTDSTPYGLLAMDMVPDVLPVHLFTRLNVEEIKQVTRRLARIQAFFYKEKIAEESVSHCRFPEVYDMICNNDTLLNMMQMAREIGADDKALIDNLDAVEKEMSRILRPVITEEIPDEQGVPRVLANGDLWSANTLFQADGDGRKLAAICDWQITHYGSAAEDLARIMCAAMSGEERREHWPSILADFYVEWEREMDGEKVPFTLQQLESQYRRIFPFAALILVPVVVPIVAYVANLNKGDKSREDSSAKMDVVMEKVKLMVEDILVFDKLNAA